MLRFGYDVREFLQEKFFRTKKMGICFPFGWGAAKSDALFCWDAGCGKRCRRSRLDNISVLTGQLIMGNITR